ncbi:VanZ family protein [Niveispirillum sp. KHB5.9]|uniref:VanZ family protein n=1 Tax=Niveispirillum sp. KHB5.9 TaxID=3400269 RepID=UPI003A852042
MHAALLHPARDRRGIPLFSGPFRRRDDRSLTLPANLLNPPAPIRHLIGALILGIAMLLLPWMAVQPALAPPGDGFSDKMMHAACFAGLAVIGHWAFRGRAARLAVMLALLSLGIGIEWAQSLVPGREASFVDVAADVTGLILANILLQRWSLARDMLSPDHPAESGSAGD